MDKTDKIKLAVAIVILIAAGVLIYFSVRDTPPPNPGGPAPASTTAPTPGGEPAAPPVPPNRRVPTK